MVKLKECIVFQVNELSGMIFQLGPGVVVEVCSIDNGGDHRHHSMIQDAFTVA